MDGVPPVPNYHSKTPAVNMSPKGNISKVCVYSFVGRRLGVCTWIYHGLVPSPPPQLLLLAVAVVEDWERAIDACNRVVSMVSS